MTLRFAPAGAGASGRGPPMAGCCHYWVLSPPAADVVRGRCKRCRAEREFPARLDETDRSNDHEDLTRSGASGTAAPALRRAA